MRRQKPKFPGSPLPADAPVGTPCALFRDNGEVLHTKTRSTVQPIPSSNGDGMVWVEGVAGCYHASYARLGIDPSVTTWSRE